MILFCQQLQYSHILPKSGYSWELEIKKTTIKNKQKKKTKTKVKQHVSNKIYLLQEYEITKIEQQFTVVVIHKYFFLKKKGRTVQ